MHPYRTAKPAEECKMKSPPSLSIRLLRVVALVAVALFAVAFGITALCYTSDGHVVNYAKCCLCGIGWALVPTVIGGIASFATWIDVIENE